MTNIKNLTRKLLNEQPQGWNCESTCACVQPNFGAGQYQDEEECIDSPNCCKRWQCNPQGLGVCEAVNNSLAPYGSEGECLQYHPSGCTPDLYTCRGCQCTQSPSGTLTQAQCQNLVATNDASCCPPPEMYSCAGCQCNISASGTLTLTQCQNLVATNDASCCPVRPDAYTCDIENCTCIVSAGGQFTGANALNDCNAALANPNHECCCIDCDPKKYMCVEEREPTTQVTPTGDIRKTMLREQLNPTMICIEDPTGIFNSMGACQACVADPTCKDCNEGDPIGEYDCVHGSGGCQAISGGQYGSMADCEANIDDHYNWGGGGNFCHCDCPGQPAGCNAAVLESPIPIINAEFAQNGGQQVGGVLDLNHDQDSQGPLISNAFRTRMAPCGPSYNAPGGKVAHDCKFWEYISTKKLPIEVWNNKVMQANPQSTNPWHMAHGQYPWTQGPGPGGQAPTPSGLGGYITNQGNILNPLGSAASGTPHPRWQRRIEAKIAYIRCLREACCKDTDWPNDGQVFTPTL